MSNRTADIESLDTGSVMEFLQRYYHIAIVGLAMVFMFFSRIRSYERFAMNDGRPALSAVDSWYHWRTIEWTAEHYPWTMPFDVFTGYPTGRYVGQFGTLFDQILATAAMIIGVGSPSTETVYTVALFMVPLMAALVAIPVFLIGRRLGGTAGGVVGVIILALAPGEFFSRTMVGQLQHHVGEVLLMAVSIFAMMVALRVAEREKPIYELIVSKEFDELRKPTIFSLLAALSLIVYLWMWPPGVVLIGILGVFFVVQLSLDVLRGVAPDYIGYVGVVTFGTTAIGSFLLLEVWVIDSVTSFGLLQPLTAALVAGGCLFMIALARVWTSRGFDHRTYPVTIAMSIGASLVILMLVLPDLYSTLMGNLTSRLLPLDPSTGAMTIAEARQPDNFIEHVGDEFGLAFYSMLVGLGLLAIRPLRNQPFHAEHTLIIVWSLFLISMAMTQIRFAYYLVLAVAVVNAVLINEVIQWVDLDEGIHRIREIETYQVLTIGIVVMVLFVPLLPPAAETTAWDRGAQGFPSDDAMVWEESNTWMAENTPPPGDWAGAGNEDELEYLGVYQYPDGGDFEYPEGAYGVMSWWDYGHLITTQANRIPHSNPFQQHATSSSAYLTAQSETKAELILDAISAGASVTDRSEEELQGIVDETESDTDVRYVMIDHKMAAGKFAPITEWTGPDLPHYIEQETVDLGEGQQVNVPVGGEAYHNTIMAQLYLNDAQGLEHYRLVHETDDYSLMGTFLNPTEEGLFAEPLQSVRLSHLVLGGVQLEGSWNNQTAQMHAQHQTARFFGQPVPFGPAGYLYDSHVVSSVKTFERVEGATISGTIDNESVIADENASVVATIELETDPGRTFTYSQDGSIAEDGSFELTVPYASVEELGVEDGYTNSSVLALGDYEVTVYDTDGPAYTGNVTVPESTVIDGESVDVTLEEVEEPPEEEPEETEEEASDNDDDDTADSLTDIPTPIPIAPEP